eukprot:gb/GECH01013924.1/.p1 GENE.gb/GECH01013924.1/~~gb/GECH01013924.1/.p1  ORF type:complete len:1159 (+),score=241.37 gb/GECH01013924.1/:1-3477(+)
MSLAKHAERLIILLEHNKCLAQRVYNMKINFESEENKPWPFKELPARFLKAVARDFASANLDTLKTQQGFEVISPKMQDVRDTLKDNYSTLQEVVKLNDATFEELDDLAQNVVDLRFETNILFLADYMNLLVGHIQLNLLLNRFAENNLRYLACLYNISRQSLGDNVDPDMTKVTKLITDSESNVVKLMQEKFLRLSQIVGKSLVHLAPSFEKHTFSYLRTQRPLELLSDPDRIPYPAADQTYLELMYSDQFIVWLVFGMMACPEALQTTPSDSNVTCGSTKVNKAMDLFALALEDCYVVPVYGDEVVAIHDIFEDTFGSYRNAQKKKILKKEKSVIKSASEKAAEHSNQLHHDRRVYLRLHLRSLLRMIQDQPGLLGPKFQLVLAALNLAKSEIMWYFNHLYVKVKLNRKIKEVKDDNMCELFYLMDQLIVTCRQHKDAISQYYLDFIRKCYLKQLKSQYNEKKDNFDGHTPEAMDSIISDLESKTEFLELRLNWKRIQAYMAGYRFKHKMAELRDLFVVMNKIYFFSRHVDDIESQLKEVSPKELYYYNSLITESFRESLSGSGSQSLYAIAFVRLLNTFPDMAHPFIEGERDRIGRECLQISTRYMEIMATYVGKALLKLRGSDAYGLLESQVGGHAAAAIQRARQAGKKKQAAAVEMLKKPGFESHTSEKSTIASMSSILRRTTQLLHSLNEFDKIIVYDRVIYPAEYVREEIKKLVLQYVKDTVILSSDEVNVSNKCPVPPVIRRPTEILDRIKVFLAELKTFEQFVNVNTRDLVLEAIFDEFSHPSHLEDPFSAAQEARDSSSLIGKIATFYADLIRAVPTLKNTVYNPVRGTFISIPPNSQLQYPIENYVDKNELRALASLIGPYGIRVVDACVLHIADDQCKQLKELLSSSSQLLESTMGQIEDGSVLQDIHKRGRGFEPFFPAVIALGTTLTFREDVRSALEYSVREHTPLIHDVVSNAYGQYPSNIFVDDTFVGVDGLAHDAGLPLRTADHALRHILMKHSQPAKLWQSLPQAFAIMLALPSLWKDASYDVSIEGWASNAHLIPVVFEDLMVMMTASNAGEGSLDIVEQRLQQLAETASMLLLNMINNKSYTTHGFNGFILLDKLVQRSEHLKRSFVESISPYAIMRSIYFEAYYPSKKQEELLAEAD